MLGASCREYRIPIKAVLKAPGATSLKILIHPAEETANARAANYSYGVPGLTQPGGLSYYNFLRKPASDFGWDWCASRPSCPLLSGLPFDGSSSLIGSPQAITGIVLNSSLFDAQGPGVRAGRHLRHCSGPGVQHVHPHRSGCTPDQRWKTFQSLCMRRCMRIQQGPGP